MYCQYQGSVACQNQDSFFPPISGLYCHAQLQASCYCQTHAHFATHMHILPHIVTHNIRALAFDTHIHAATYGHTHAHMDTHIHILPRTTSGLFLLTHTCTLWHTRILPNTHTYCHTPYEGSCYSGEIMLIISVIARALICEDIGLFCENIKHARLNVEHAGLRVGLFIYIYIYIYIYIFVTCRASPRETESREILLCTYTRLFCGDINLLRCNLRPFRGNEGLLCEDTVLFWDYVAFWTPIADRHEKQSNFGGNKGLCYGDILLFWYNLGLFCEETRLFGEDMRALLWRYRALLWRYRALALQYKAVLTPVAGRHEKKRHFRGDVGPFWGVLGLFCRDIVLFHYSTGLFWRLSQVVTRNRDTLRRCQYKAFVRTIRAFLRGAFFVKIWGLFCEDIGLFCEDIGLFPYSIRPCEEH